MREMHLKGRSSLRLSATACVIMAVSRLVSPGHAMEIDFEEGEGYVAGESPVGIVLNGATWHGKAGFGEVAPGEGVDGGRSLRIPPIGQFASLDVSPDFEGMPSRTRFSAMVRLESLVGGSFQVPLRIRAGLDGEAEAFRIHYYEGGKVEYFSAGEILRAGDGGEGEFFTREGVYSELVVDIDYDRRAYRLQLDGIAQKAEDGSEWLPFVNDLEHSSAGRVEFTSSHATSGGAHLDRISWKPNE